MVFNGEYMKKIVYGLYFTLAIKISSFIKLSYIIGSDWLFFSCSSMVAPLAGAFGGLAGCNIVLLMRLIFHIMFFNIHSMGFLALYIPGFCASLYWATNSALVRLILPILCMILFIVHPTGSQAFVYSFFWFIPILLFFKRHKRSIFFEALGSTFVAHAVGSVIWLYTVPMTSAMWLGLIPCVIVERILCALGMVVLYKVIVIIKDKSMFLSMNSRYSSIKV
jgi:hypothetical protein